MSNIKRVSAYFYKKMLFRTKKELNDFMEREKEEKKYNKEHEQLGQFYNRPNDFVLPKGFLFEFLVIYPEKEEVVYYKKYKSLSSAINCLLKKHKQAEQIDYEVGIVTSQLKDALNNNYYLDLHSMPDDNPIHLYL